MPIKILSDINVTSNGQFEDLTVKDDLSAVDLFATGAHIKQADITFSSYSENTMSVDINSYTATLDLSQGNTFTILLTSSINKFVLNNIPANTASFTLVINQDSINSPKDIDWVFEGQILKWSGGAPQITQTLSATDIYSFVSFTSGGTWYGFIGGQDFV